MKSLKLSLTYLAAGLTALSPVAMAAPQQASKQEINEYLAQYVNSPKTFNELYSKNHSLFDQRSRSLIETWLEKYGNEKAPQIKSTTVRDDKGQEKLQITMTVSGETITIAESNEPGFITVNGQKISLEQTKNITSLFNEMGKNNPEYKQSGSDLDNLTVPMTSHPDGLNAEQFSQLKPEQKAEYLLLLRKEMEAAEKVLNGSMQTTASSAFTDKVYAYENHNVIFKGSIWDLLSSSAAYAKTKGTKSKKTDSAPTFDYPAEDPIGIGTDDNAGNYFGVSRSPASVGKENLGWPVGSSCIVAGNIGLIKIRSDKRKSCNPIVSDSDQKLADRQKQPPIPKEVFQNNRSCANQNSRNDNYVACNPIIYGYDINDKLFCVDSKAPNFSTQATEMCNSKSPLSDDCPAAASNRDGTKAYTKECLSQFRRILESYYKHNNKTTDISSCFDANNNIKKDAKNNNQNCIDLFNAQINVYNDLKTRAKYVCSPNNAISEFPGQKEACLALEKRVLDLQLYADSVGGSGNDGHTTVVPTFKPTNPSKKKFCDNSSKGIKSFLCSSKFWTGVAVGVGASVLACKTHLFGMCRKKTVTNTITNTITKTIYVPTPVTTLPPATEGGSGTGSGTSGGVRTDGSQ